MDRCSKTVNLEDFNLQTGPPTVYYIPNFVTEIEEQDLINEVSRVPKPKWTQLSNRRLQNWGGIPHPKGMIAEEIPNWLRMYTEKIGSLNLFDGKIPNHVLVNEYTSGQGIMPHLDGPLFYPTISTISLGSHTILNFYQPFDDNREDGLSHEVSKVNSNWNDRHVYSLLLQPRSLLILKDRMYDQYLHGIEEIQEDIITNTNDRIINFDKCNNSGVILGQKLQRSTRVSLTIRYVPKTTKKPMIKLGR